MPFPSRSKSVRDGSSQYVAMRFVLLVGVLSFFADFTYESARSILGPFLLTLGATATAIGFISGVGELLGYGLRLVSGRWADATGKFWPITIFGYVVQMASVPALALSHTVWQAALLIILERVGKAIRNPPRDVMLSHAGARIGQYGFVFGIHEAMDQFGAMCGPLIIAAVIAHRGSYREAFAILMIPAVFNLTMLMLARLLYPDPGPLDEHSLSAKGQFPGAFWVYLAGAGLVAAGFADYPVIAYHFQVSGTVTGQWIAIFYAIAMGVSGTASMIFGRMFDHHGFKILLPLTIVCAASAPLVFLGNFWIALLGAGIWGIGMGVHESIIPAAVSPMVGEDRRASAFGLFTAGYGVAWFLGSATIGWLYDKSISDVIIFSVLCQVLALPLLWRVSRFHKSVMSRT